MVQNGDSGLFTVVNGGRMVDSFYCGRIQRFSYHFFANWKTVGNTNTFNAPRGNLGVGGSEIADPSAVKIPLRKLDFDVVIFFI